jgi:predicted nucleic acid-binding protein
VRFWDSSAVIPLVIEESASEIATGWLREDDGVVIWTLTSVEVVSALERRVREGRLKERDALAAEDGALSFLESAHEIIAIEPAKALARRILRTHPLRAADSLQLAGALLWAEGNPDGSVFHTLDRRLGLAALREGFRVVPDPGAP